MKGEEFPAEREKDNLVFDPSRSSSLVRRGVDLLNSSVRLSKAGTLSTADQRDRHLWTFAPYSRRHPELAAERPAAPLLNPEAIPAELRQRRQWICWEWGRHWNWYYGEEFSTWGKVPISPVTGGQERGPATWGSFDEALAFQRSQPVAGVGFVFTQDDPYVGVDIDHCRDCVTGALSPVAMAIVDYLSSYTEISPSEDGIHIILKSEFLPHRPLDNGLQAEFFVGGHFLTFTGNHVQGSPTAVRHRQAQLQGLPDLDLNIDDPKWDLFGGPARGQSVSVSRGDDFFVRNVELGASSIVVLTDQRLSVKLDRASGAVISTSPISRPFKTAPVISQETELIVGEEEVWGVNVYSREVKWRQKTGENCDWMLLRGIGLFYLVDGTLIAIDVQSGDRRWVLEWKFPEDSFLISERHIYCITMEGDFFVADVVTGEMIEQRRAAVSRKSRLLAVWNDLVFIESVAGIEAQRLKTGERAWFRRRNHEIEQLSRSLVHSMFITPEDSRYPAATYTADLIDDVLYASDQNGSLLAIDATTGKELWQQPISDPAWFIQADAGVVYVADTHALRAIRR